MPENVSRLKGVFLEIYLGQFLQKLVGRQIPTVPIYRVVRQWWIVRKPPETFGNLPETCRKPAGNLSETCLKPPRPVYITENLPETCRKPAAEVSGRFSEVSGQSAIDGPHGICSAGPASTKEEKSQCCTRQWLDNVDAQISSHTTLGNLPRKIDGASPQNICNCCYCRHLFLSSKLHIYYIESRSIDPAWETSHDWPPPPPSPSWSPSELGPSAAAARGMSAARESSLRNFVTLTTRLSYVHRSSPSLASCI